MVHMEPSRGFSAGAKVEVHNDDEGFRGAWYEATVVQSVARRRCSVEYSSLFSDKEFWMPLIVELSKAAPMLLPDAAHRRRTSTRSMPPIGAGRSGASGTRPSRSTSRSPKTMRADQAAGAATSSSRRITRRRS